MNKKTKKKKPAKKHIVTKVEVYGAHVNYLAIFCNESLIFSATNLSDGYRFDEELCLLLTNLKTKPKIVEIYDEDDLTEDQRNLLIEDDPDWKEYLTE